MKVADILGAKGHEVMTVRPTETVDALAHRLKLEHVGAMIVSQDGKSIEGIITERDVAYGLATYGAGLLGRTVSELMMTSVVTCSPDDAIADVAETMTQRRMRHIPVRHGGELIGVVSLGDVVKHRLDEMKLEANVLRDYAIAHR